VQPIHVDPPAEFLSDKVPLVLVAAPTTDLDVGEDITPAARFRNAVIAARRSPIVPTVEVAHGDAAIARRSKRLVLPGARLLADLAELPGSAGHGGALTGFPPPCAKRW